MSTSTHEHYEISLEKKYLSKRINVELVSYLNRYNDQYIIYDIFIMGYLGVNTFRIAECNCLVTEYIRLHLFLDLLFLRYLKQT